MFEISRRGFFSRAGIGVLSLCAVRTAAAELPRWPKPGPPLDANAGAPEKLPAFAAASERSDGPNMQPLPFDERVGFAVVGLGRLAIEEILPAFLQSKICKVTALVSGDPVKAKRLAREYSVPVESCYSYSDFDRIRDNNQVQVVYVVLPNSLHKEFVLRASSAGKNVLCEKPMATSVADAEAMISACHQHKVKLMIAYRQQYEPNNLFMRELIQEKTFGKLKIFEASNFQCQNGQQGGPQQWRHVKALAGGGALPDIGLYCLNASRFLTSEEPQEVSGQIYSTPGDPRFKEVEESVTWQMTFPSGLIAVCSASYGAHETKRYRFTAEKGWFGMDPAFSYRGLKSEVSYALGSPFEHHENLGFSERNQFALEMDHMADCLRRGKTPRTPGEEGLKDQRIMAAIYESARTRKPVIV